MLLLIAVQSGAQQRSEVRDYGSAEVLYDRPGEIRKLFLGVQPLYGEFFTAGVNAGFGIDAHYLPGRKFDARLQFRRPWASRFFDQAREDARRNSDTDNDPLRFHYIEAGFSYHIIDRDAPGKLRVIVYDRRLKGEKWAATVPETKDFKGQVRTILSARTGMLRWQSSLDVSGALGRQGKTNSTVGLPETIVDELGRTLPFRAYANMKSIAVFGGIGFTRIRNAAVGFQKFESTLDDGIMGFYADLMYAPSLSFESVSWSSDIYPIDGLKKASFGYRVGLDSKFNRVIGLGLGAEAGKRPGPAKDNFYLVLKASLPVLGSNLIFPRKSGK
ncbi:MAG: hypothetical protein ACKO3B_11220 [Bacteroidota bacterium]